MRPTVPASVTDALFKRIYIQAPTISPLARAALDNGVAFEDVTAYAQYDAQRTAEEYRLRSWEMLIDGGGE